MAKPGLSPPSTHRMLALLSLILRDRGDAALNFQARELDLPLSTAYRLASKLCEAGFIRRLSPGVFAQGLELTRLTFGMEPGPLLAAIARPHLERLARRLHLTVHLGVIERDMVTYMIKAHGGGPELFTRVGTQLDAYCSAIGKVLLAALSKPDLETYLSAGPLMPLTPNTIARTDDLKTALDVVRVQGYAVDAEEVMENLRCIAVPILGRLGGIIAAVSASRRVDVGADPGDRRILAALRDCTKRISARL